MAEALAVGVEKIIRSADVSMRSAVLRDLRARFSPKDPVQVAESGSQADMEPPAPIVAAITAAAVAVLPQPPLEREESLEAATPEQSSRDGSAMYDRLQAWEVRKEARLEAERQKAEEKMRATLKKTPSSSGAYAHVQSVIKKERIALEDVRVTEAETRAGEAVIAKEHAERVADVCREQVTRTQHFFLT